MYTDPAALTHSTLADAPGNALMIDARYKQILWIVGIGDDRKAICLTDECSPRWSFILAEDNYTWNGVLIESVRLEVNPDSTENDQGPKLGSLRAKRGQLAAFVNNTGTRRDGMWTSVMETPNLKQELYFTRWRLVVGEGDSLTVLAEFGDDGIAFPTFNRPAATSITR